ncbi:MAG: hypothetical protein IJG39_10285 [Synergistaceae bacterium]|nr:hypothetical protein [Synergistaceae bacterium]
MRLSEQIERISRKPKAELLREKAHLSFDEERYGNDYCENNCPLEELRYEGICAECPGDCREWEWHIEDGQRKVYAADVLIGEVLRNGYQALGVEGANEPFTPDWSGYAYVDWEDAYEGECGICGKCEKFGTSGCPEDILSAECVRSGDAWAVERIAAALNGVM